MNAASNFRYLNIAGVSNRWVHLAFVSFAAAVVWVRAAGERPSMGPYFFFFLVPIAAGTGLLTAARKGELDLLFGAGKTRASVWRSAFLRAWVVPAAMAVTVLLLSGPLAPGMSLLPTTGRLFAVLLFTGGLGFAIGLVELRYLTGVIWLLLRLIFIMTPPGLSTVAMMARGVEIPSTSSLLACMLAAPETLLEPRMPLPYVFLGGSIGVAAIALSYVWFQRAELGGKRL